MKGLEHRKVFVAQQSLKPYNKLGTWSSCAYDRQYTFRYACDRKHSTHLGMHMTGSTYSSNYACSLPSPCMAVSPPKIAQRQRAQEIKHS